MWKAMLLCEEGMQWRQYPVEHESVSAILQSSSCLSEGHVWRMHDSALFRVESMPIRTCMSYASPCNKHTFGLKIHFIVKFSRKSLSEWFSCRTFAPRWRQEGWRGKEARRSQQVPQEVAKAEDSKRVYMCADMPWASNEAKQACKCHIAHSAHIKNTAKQAEKCRFRTFWAHFVCFAVSCKTKNVNIP